MGFFDSSTTTTSTYDNPELRQYTAAYRGAAPWGFASLDPTATLAAMGQGSSVAGKDLGAGYKEYLKGLSADEKKQAESTNAALGRIKTRQESGQFLTPQETDFINSSLDKAFEYAHKTGYADWEKATQMMAGSRGLHMSDTPIAEPAMRELRNFETGLGSKRAELGLNATLNMSTNQQNFDQAFTQFQQSLQFNKMQARQGFLFGGGLSAAGNLGYTQTQKVQQKASGFQQFMGGLSMASGVLDLGSKIGAMGMGMPGGGGGGGSWSSPNTGGMPMSSSFFGPGQ